MIARIILLCLGLATSYCRAADPPITAMALTPDGASIVVGSQAGVEIRSWPELKSVRRLPLEISQVQDISFSPDGKQLALAGGRPGESGILEVIRWPAGDRAFRSNEHQDVVNAIAWSKNGETIATASSDRTIRLTDARTGRSIKVLDGHSKGVMSVAFLPGDHELISGSLDESLRVWNIATGQSLRSLNNHTRYVHAIRVRPSNDLPPVVASIAADRTVRFWQPTVGRLVRFVRLPSEPLAICWTRDAKCVVIGCSDGRVRVVDLESAEVRSERVALPGVIHCLAVAGDDAIVVGGEHGTIKTLRP